MSFKSTVYGKYILLDRVAVGGMAEVFKAKSYGVHGFERLLVIKRILPHLNQDEEFIEMFIDEAKIAVELTHANICQVNDLGKIEGNYFIAMEYINGKDLRAILKKSFTSKLPLKVPFAMYIAMEALKGLDYAHNKSDPISGKPLRLIHRDVSPQNIMISYHGEIKIVDFGIAKTESKLHRTQAGVLKGKFGYMSPEQASGTKLDQTTDLFSMGIILFETLSGRRLFHSDTDFKTLEAIKTCTIPSLRKYNEDVSPELESIIHKALSKSPSDRFGSAQEMQSALSNIFYTKYPNFNVKELSSYLKNLFHAEIEKEQKSLKQSMDSIPKAQIAKVSGGSASPDETTVADIRDPGMMAPEPSIEDRTQSRLEVSHASKTGKHLQSSSPRKKILVFLAGFLSILGIAAYFWPQAKSEKKPSSQKLEQAIQISSTPPGATFIIEGEAKGVTPMNFNFVGNKVYEIQLRKSGYETLEDQLLIRPGQKRLSFDLKKKAPPMASLSIDSNPQGAQVLINGQAQGQLTPTTIHKLKQDESVTITLQKPGFKPSNQVVTPIKELESISLSLEKASANLLIRTSPSSAKVFLNGQAAEKQISDLDPEKTYTVKVTAPGYHSHSRKLTPKEGDNEMQVQLKKRAVAKGTVNISAIPWATVIIDGKKIGSTPVLNHTLNVGTHTVVFQHQDYPDLKKVIQIRKGENPPVIIDFNSN